MKNLVVRAGQILTDAASKIEAEIEDSHQATADLIRRLDEVNQISIEAVDNAAKIAIEAMETTMKTFLDVTTVLKEMLATEHEKTVAAIWAAQDKREQALKGVEPEVNTENFNG